MVKQFGSWLGLVAGAVLSLWALAAAPASATSIKVRSLEDLTHASATVVHGTVTRIESFWDRDHTAIYTRATVTRQDVLKGNVPEEINVFLPGGTVGDRRSVVVDAPELTPGEEVVLFLKHASRPAEGVDLPTGVSPFHLTDLFQGKFEVVVDRAPGQRVAVSHAARLVAGHTGAMADQLPGGMGGLPLAELKRRIEQVR